MNVLWFPKQKFFLSLLSLLILLSQAIWAADCPHRKKEALYSWLIKTRADTSYFCSKFQSPATTCLSTVKDYFSNVYETRTTVDNFSNVCKRMTSENVMEECINVIVDLEEVCFNMESAYNLIHGFIGPQSFKIIGSKTFQFLMKITQSETPEQFITATDCPNVLKGRDANVVSIPQFTGSLINLDEAHTVFKKFMDIYEVLKQQLSPTKPFCYCGEILYIPLVAKDPNKINDYYTAVCKWKDERPLKKHFWNKDHFVKISESSSPVDEKSLSLFLRYGYPLIDLGHWFITSDHTYHWSFDDIRESIDLKPDYAKLDVIPIVARAMYGGFTYDDFKKFSDLTSDFRLNNSDCRKQILDLFLDAEYYTTQPGQDNYLCTRNDKIYVKNSKDIFMTHFQLLRDIMFKSNNYNDCEKIIKGLARWKRLIYRTSWPTNSLTIILKLVDNKNVGVDSAKILFECLELAAYMETEISSLGMLLEKQKPTNKQLAKDWIIADAYVTEFAILRYELLSLDVSVLRDRCNPDRLKKSSSKSDMFALVKGGIYKSDANNLNDLFVGMLHDYNHKISINKVNPVV